jgi:hypothetical protein
VCVRVCVCVCVRTLCRMGDGESINAIKDKDQRRDKNGLNMPF